MPYLRVLRDRISIQSDRESLVSQTRIKVLNVLPNLQMSLAEFLDLLERSGETPEAWPDELRPAALALLHESEQARAALDEFRLLRRALTQRPMKAPAGLARKIALDVTEPAESPAPITRPGKKVGERSDR